ncbi:FMRFamide receptor, partial [Orchesella cincta]
ARATMYADSLLNEYLSVSSLDAKFTNITPDQKYPAGDVLFRDLSRFWVQFISVPIVVVVGVLGNVIIIHVLTRKSMHSSTNVNSLRELLPETFSACHFINDCRYLTALGISDLFYLLFTASMSWRHYPSFDRFWLYWSYIPIGLWITDAFSSTSVWLTVSFTVERYVAVFHPISGTNLRGEKRAVSIAIAMYILCFAFTAPTVFEWELFASGKTPSLYTEQSIYSVNGPHLARTKPSVFFITGVRKTRIARNTPIDDFREDTISARHIQLGICGIKKAFCVVFQRQREENRVTVILIAVVMLFVFCQLPTAAVLIYSSFISLPASGSAEENILLGLGNIFNLLVAINAASNWVLYTALSEKYRRQLCYCFMSNRHANRTVPARVNNAYDLRQFPAGIYNND